MAELCSHHTHAACHPELRRIAYTCLVRLTAATDGLDVAISLALDAVQAETSPLVRYELSIIDSATGSIEARHVTAVASKVHILALKKQS